jgi:hypothetical protein
MRLKSPRNNDSIYRGYIGTLCITITIVIIGFVYVTKYYNVANPLVPKPFIERDPYILVDVTTASSTPPRTDIIPPTATTSPTTLFQYIEVIDGCGPHYDTNECLNARSGPGVTYPIVASLRNGIVLRTTGEISTEEGVWYRVIFDEWVRYPERVAPVWYVAGAYVRAFSDVGPLTFDPAHTPTTSKQILIERSSQTLTAYEGDTVVMTATTSTGRAAFPTPRGTFTIFKKTPSRYMQGPLPNIPGSGYYDLPGVPWNLYFTEQGAVIHGAYWHNSFGAQYSHGCVNLTPVMAQQLYHWADVGTTVVVRD